MEKLYRIQDEYNLTGLGEPSFFPERMLLEDHETDWEQELDDYSPADFTADFVYANEGVWANGDLNEAEIEERELLDIDIQYDEDGRPLNPYGRTGIRGRGSLGRYGANPCGGVAILNETHDKVVVVKRKSGDYGLPGGFMEFIDDGLGGTRLETGEEAARREVMEEVNIDLGKYVLHRVIEKGGLFIPAPITTDNAWVEWDTYAAVVHEADVTITPDTTELQDAEWMSVNEALIKLLPAFQYLVGRLFQTFDY